MQYKIINSADQITKLWSGGTTTQLFIWPQDADYAKRNFLFRLSTATVETETSEFTQLPGIFRKIMILEGETRLEHEGYHSKTLKAFEQDAFEGDWKTLSFGSCTDFNLMTSGNCSGSLKAQHLIAAQSVPLQASADTDFLFIYLCSGSLQISIENERLKAEKGDLFLLQNPDAALLLSAEADCSAVIVEVQCLCL
jgi:uncharacterized protein